MGYDKTTSVIYWCYPLHGMGNNVMRTDIYLFVNKCIRGEIELGSYREIQVKRKHCMWRYIWQIDRAYPLVDIEIQDVLTRKAKANRSKLKRQCKAMFEQGILDSYTITERKIEITFFEDYVAPDRDQIIPIRFPNEPMPMSEAQNISIQLTGKHLHGFSGYKEQMRQPFIYKSKE